MINVIHLVVGVLLAFTFAIYIVFWRCNLHRESEGNWFVLYFLIPIALLLGSMLLLYIGIRGLM